MTPYTVAELIAYLRDNYKLDDTLLVNIYTEDDYRVACGDTTIPWTEGANILTQEFVWDWLNPEVYDWMAKTIGEEEEKENG